VQAKNRMFFTRWRRRVGVKIKKTPASGSMTMELPHHATISEVSYGFRRHCPWAFSGVCWVAFVETLWSYQSVCDRGKHSYRDPTSGPRFWGITSGPAGSKSGPSSGSSSGPRCFHLLIAYVWGGFDGFPSRSRRVPRRDDR
jgi:hypothetical protein